jgi:hypothetical protein
LAVERRQRERCNAEDADGDREDKPSCSRLRPTPIRAKPRSVT